MTQKEIIDIVERLAMPVISENEFELVDIEYLKEGSLWYLRVFVDKKDGVTINDCEIVSRYLSKLLDEKDPIKTPYILEVSSPGLDRPLKKDSDYERYKGKLVFIKLYKSIENKKEFTGILEGLQDGVVTISADEESMSFNKKDMALCRLEIEF